MSAVSTEWSPSKVKYLARYINGYPFKPVDWSDRGRPIIRIQNLSNPDSDPNYFEGEIPEVYLVKRGDLLLSWSATLGAYEWPGPDAWLNQHIFKVDLDTNQVSKKYYRWLADWFMRELDSEAHGSTMQHLTKDRFGGFKLQLPPPALQETISNYLDRETARIDGLIAEKERMLALLDEKRAALISRVVTRGLDPNAPLKPSNAPWFDKTPTAWSVERLKWIIQSVSSGVSVNASDQPVEGDGFGVLKTSAVAGGAFLPGENKSVWDTEYERLACPVTRDTIIMSRMNTPNLVGESGYVAEDYPNLYLPDRLWQISFDASRVFVPFMSLLLASKEARHALSAMATGTSPSMKNLAIEEMASLLVPVPSLEEQKAIYEEVARREATIAPLKNELANSLLLLKERRAALITAAVTGQIPLEEMTG